MKFKTAYAKHERETAPCVGKSLTHQSEMASCDINRIMHKFEKTGILEHRNNFEGQYGDFLDASDYQTSINQVIEADEMFQTLPAKLRRRFHNDPAAFLEYVSNPENTEEMYQLGLAIRPAEDDKDDPAPPTTKKGSKRPMLKPEPPSDPESED